MAKRRTFRVGLLDADGNIYDPRVEGSEAAAYKRVSTWREFHAAGLIGDRYVGVRVDVREAGSDVWQPYERLSFDGRDLL